MLNNITSDVLIFDLNFVSVYIFGKTLESLLSKRLIRKDICVSKINVSEKLCFELVDADII